MEQASRLIATALVVRSSHLTYARPTRLSSRLVLWSRLFGCRARLDAEQAWMAAHYPVSLAQLAALVVLTALPFPHVAVAPTRLRASDQHRSAGRAHPMRVEASLRVACPGDVA